MQERIDFSPHPKTLTMAGDYEYFAAQASSQAFCPDKPFERICAEPYVNVCFESCSDGVMYIALQDMICTKHPRCHSTRCCACSA